MKQVEVVYRGPLLLQLLFYQKIFNMNEFIKYLRNLIGMSADSFRTELTKWVERNELEKDDYSFIIIDL